MNGFFKQSIAKHFAQSTEGRVFAFDEFVHVDECRLAVPRREGDAASAMAIVRSLLLARARRRRVGKRDAHVV